MRALTPYEMDLITGGKFSQTQNVGIYVTGHPPSDPPSDPPGWFDPPDTSGGGGGGGSSGGTGAAQVAMVHEQHCSSKEAAATSIANDIKNTSTTHPTGANWTNTEFGAVIISEGDGTYGAGNNSIYTNGSSNKLDYPAPVLTSGQTILGTIHNHPDTGNNDHNAVGRYPSDDDWENLGQIANYNHLNNPSMFIIDSAGVTREFSLIDRYVYQQYTSEQDKIAGSRLPTPNTTPGCS